MIRPELRAAFWRWREVLAGTALALLCLRWAWGAGGVVEWIAWAGTGAGIGCAIAGLQRGRLRRSTLGAGIVRVDERRITYMGPETGGLADMDLVTRLEIADGPSWRLVNETGHDLHIPVDALGADALFDLFAALPGLGLANLQKALDAQPGTVIWKRAEHRLH